VTLLVATVQADWDDSGLLQTDTGQVNGPSRRFQTDSGGDGGRMACKRLITRRSLIHLRAIGDRAPSPPARPVMHQHPVTGERPPQPAPSALSYPPAPTAPPVPPAHDPAATAGDFQAHQPADGFHLLGAPRLGLRQVGRPPIVPSQAGFHDRRAGSPLIAMNSQG
jgi:hypothetical protein